MTLHCGDCLNILKQFPDESFDLVYLDPPFFTQKVHRLKTRDRTTEFSFSDTWASNKDYISFLHVRLKEMKRVLASTGSIFFHCDRSASHLIRILLDDVFSTRNFRSEIIWYYRRWSNSQKSLLPAHQTIYYYTKSNQFTFNTIYQDYSESTNVDQILQRRCRDSAGKSVYERDLDGNTVPIGDKPGVPLSDVWDIPYLNPKAEERVGYPTQKPVLLLERIIELASNRGDSVLDPFCGSGTTLVAASLWERKHVGIDISEEAISLTSQRLLRLVKTRSNLLEKGRGSYNTANKDLLSVLGDLDYVPVHRNKGIDAILKQGSGKRPVLIRIQRDGETVEEAANLLVKASQKKEPGRLFLIVTTRDSSPTPPGVRLIETPKSQIKQLLS